MVVTDADVLVNAHDRASLLVGLEAHAGRLARGEVGELLIAYHSPHANFQQLYKYFPEPHV